MRILTGARPAGLPLLAAAALVLAACAYQVEETPARQYSGAFWYWINESTALRFELEEASRDATADLSSVIAQAVERQEGFNQALRDARPPERWSAAQGEILKAIEAYDAAVTDAFVSSETSPETGLTRLEQALRLLRERVSTCYALARDCV